MSDNNNCNNTQNGQSMENFQPLPPPERFGCAAWLGVLILLGAIAAVLYFLVLKPHWEKEGIDVDEKIEEIKQQASATGTVLKENAAKAVDAGVRGAKVVRQGAADLWNKTQESSEKVSEAAEQGSEAAAETAEKTVKAKEKVQEKAKEKVDSWY